MKIVLSPNPYRDRGLRAAQAAQRILEGAGASTAICLPFEVEQGGRLDLPPRSEERRVGKECAA